MIRDNEQEWKRDLYKRKNAPLAPTFGSRITNPTKNNPSNPGSNEDEWKRELYQKQLAAQPNPSGNPGENPGEAAAFGPSLLTSPFPVAPEDKGKEGKNPAAKAEKDFTQKARVATAEALRQSWLNIIETCGLTFLYIIFHYIFAYLGGPFARFFPRAGREWTMKNLRKLPLPKKMKDWSVETTGAVIEPFELMVFFYIIGIVVAQILMYVIIIYAFTHPCEVAEILDWDWIRIFLEAKCVFD